MLPIEILRYHATGSLPPGASRQFGWISESHVTRYGAMKNLNRSW